MTKPRTHERLHQLQIEQVEPASLTPYARNSKRHPADQIQLIANSIREFGFLSPIVIDESDQIMAGHARVKAAILLGLETIPAVRAHNLTPQQRRAFVIADNRLAEIASWDNDMLASELQAILDESGIDVMALTGFSSNDLDALLAETSHTEEITEEHDSSTPTESERLKFGEHSVLLSAAELARLSALLEQFQDRHGHHGFVTWLLEGAGAQDVQDDDDDDDDDDEDDDGGLSEIDAEEP